MEKEKKEREKRLGNMSKELQKERRDNKLCIWCGKKGHGQYTCTTPKPVISSTSRKRKSPTPSEDEEEEERPRKKKSGEDRITARSPHVQLRSGRGYFSPLADA